MIYLIGQSAIWLLLTAASAALAGWAFAAHRAAPARRALRRNRDRLVEDLASLAAGEDRAEAGPVTDAGESLSRIRESRIAELERALESARARADDASAEVAELRRRLEREASDAEELSLLRAAAAEHEQVRAREIETAVIDTRSVEDAGADDDGALQAWRLRYFEQRVRYLEEAARATIAVAPALAPASEQDQPLEWRAREAEARAAHLQQELRALAAAPARGDRGEAEPFAADADLEALLRWRLRYLERRVTHLQARGVSQAAAPVEPVGDAGPDPDRWKWRARYLEARVRHLEQRPAGAQSLSDAAAPPTLTSEAPLREARPVRPGIKPPLLASARNGAPDDLTLIEEVSQLQQNALYALGVFHFDQIAAWSPDHVAWVDKYFRLRGRIEDEDWIEQASDLAREGPAAARRAFENEDA